MIPCEAPDLKLRGLDFGKKSGSDAISRRSRDGTDCTKVESWADRETSGDTFEDERLGRWFKLVLEACRSEHSLDEGSPCGGLFSTAHACRRPWIPLGKRLEGIA